ncbi:MAG: HNH endonuclease [Victivallales bacterium]|nr:HNH endonuclease [Victivallales bacterium]
MLSYWIVKANPRYNEPLNEMFILGKKQEWHAKRIPANFEKGDKIIFWQSGTGLKVIAIGEVVSLSREKQEDGQLIYSLRYLSEVLSQQPNIKKLREMELFSNASFLKSAAAGAIYPLKNKQGEFLYNSALQEWNQIQNNPLVILTKLLSDDTIRKATIVKLAEFWHYAKSKFPDKTFITLFPNCVRMNIGMVKFFVIASNTIHINLDRKKLPLSKAEQNKAGHYKSAPDAIERYGDKDTLPVLVHDFDDEGFNAAAYSMIEKLGLTRKHPITEKSHSPELAAYLESVYDMPSIADQTGHNAASTDQPDAVTAEAINAPIISEAEEGLKRYREYVVFYQRNQPLINAKKALHQNDYRCEVCGFSFKDKYGTAAKECLEVHHINPLAEREGKSITKIEDLILLCQNCHALIHSQRPPLEIDALKEMLSSGER